MNKGRALLGLGIAAGLSAAVLAVPLPYVVSCPVEITPRGATSVYVDVPGLVRVVHLRSGPITSGQPIVELDDVEARLAEQRLAGQRDQLATRVESIRQRAHTDDQALLELAHAEEALNALEIQLARRREEIARLVVRAPVAGMFLPAQSKPRPAAERTHLASWSGRPLDSRNAGALLESSTLLGKIAQPGQLEAILAVPQEEMDFVRPGQRVELLLTQLPGERLAGQIEHISSEELKVASDRLSTRGGGQLATLTTAEGYEKPLGVVYQASVPLVDDGGWLVTGGTGVAKIHAGWQPIAARLWRAACRTFRFEM